MVDHHLVGMISWQQPKKPGTDAAALYEYYHYYYDDDQYLFRLASTFGWDEVMALCASLVQDIEVAVSRLHHHHHRGERQSDIEHDSRGQHYHNSDANDDSDSYPTYNDENYFNDSLSLLHGNENYKISGSNTTLLVGDGDGVSVGDDFGRKQNSVHAKDVSASLSSHHHHHLRQCLHRAHSQLYYIDQWGNTPLHAASYVKPPLRVIEGMFQVGRLIWKYYTGYYWLNSAKVGKMTPIWAQLCKDGSTPFLVACSTGASLSVLRCYLDEIEYYIKQQWVPSNSHYSKMAVLSPDNQGNSPVMGYMSFHHNWITRNSNEFHRPSRIQGDFAAAAPPPPPPPALREYWNFACRMLRFAAIPTSFPMMEVEDYSTVTLVHWCASIACHCPVSLLEWVVSLPSRYAVGDAVGMGWFPGDVCAATEDEEGKLPLHRALEGRGLVDSSSGCTDYETTNLDSCAGKTSSASSMPITGLSHNNIINNNVHLKLERNRLQIVQKLLRWYPPAANTVLPNGRSPLVHAIAHGGSWHGIGSVMSTATKGANNKNNNDAHLGLLQLLWRYSPEQSLEIDPVSGLYPFMLAATIALPDGLSSRPERSGHESIVLENVYNLLRQDPQVFSLGLS